MDCTIRLSLRAGRGIHAHSTVGRRVHSCCNILMHIHVGGTLSEPKAKLKTFRGIQRGWQGLFGGVGNQLNRINPMARQSDNELVSVPDDGDADKKSDQ